MVFFLGCKPDKNGNIYRVKVDTDARRYYPSYTQFNNTDIHATKKEINGFIDNVLKPAGYTATIKL